MGSCKRVPPDYSSTIHIKLTDTMKRTAPLLLLQATNPTLGFAVRTTITAFVFVFVYGLYFAWTTALNNIVSSAVLIQNATYAMPRGILVTNCFRTLVSRTSSIRKEGKVLPPQYLGLRKVFDLVCYVFSVSWIVVLCGFVSSA
ncbi:hypothetical protein BDV18DRAFT_22583 [Aspergillus unguis]